MKKISIFIIILAVIAAAGGALYLSNKDASNNNNEEEQNKKKNEEQINIDTGDWETYKNEEYGFSIKHPADWKINETTDHPTSVLFNIYRPSEEVGEPPYDHHVSGVAHVSVYPQGIPTEGIFGKYVDTEVDFKEETVEVRDYVLSDGTPFVTQANFSSFPSNWNESGFVFARAPISDLSVEYKRDGEAISEEEFDPEMGDTPIRHGSIDKRTRAIEVAMLGSFELIERSSGKEDLIRVSEPEENTTVSSPLVVSGEARGSWYFEGDFPVRLEDAKGKILTEDPATAQGEWMTEDFVKFESELSFEEPDTATGTLILEKANPSGREENEETVSVPVKF